MKVFASVRNGSTYIVYVQDDFVELTQTKQIEFAELNPTGVTMDEIVNGEKAIHVPPLEELKNDALNTLAQQKYNVCAQGFTPSGKDYALAMFEDDQQKFTRLLALVNEGLLLGQLAETTLVNYPIDKNGVTHPSEVLEIKEMLFAYGFYIAQVENEFYSKELAIKSAQNEAELAAVLQ